jgi:predicted enzyme related to lactoylglutathione lyase
MTRMRPALSNPVVHLELHTGDLRRARSFYSELCRWRPEEVDASECSYLALNLGAIGGGAVECGTPRALWLPYVEVPEIAAATERARELGGSILLEPREGPSGWRSVVSVPDGAEVALWQQKGP